jgi:hypothetical protein
MRDDLYEYVFVVHGQSTEVSMEKRAAPMNWRPTRQNRERLEKALDMGFEMTEILNGLVEKHFDSFVKEAARERIQKMQAVLATR